MKLKFEAPSVELIVFSTDDVITTSGDITMDDDQNKGEWDS